MKRELFKPFHFRQSAVLATGFILVAGLFASPPSRAEILCAAEPAAAILKAREALQQQDKRGDRRALECLADAISALQEEHDTIRGESDAPADESRRVLLPIMKGAK
jgi:hypothetical protein